MLTQKIALFGNAPNIEHAIRQFLPNHWTLVTVQDFQANGPPPFKLAIIGHYPPLSNGLELLLKLRQACPALPAIIAGPSLKPFEMAEALRLGANDFLFLPLEQEPLLNCLQRFENQQFEPKPTGFWGRIRAFFTQHRHEAQKAAIVAPGMVYSPATPVFAPDERPDIQVGMLGQLSVMVKGTELPKPAGRKTKALLAFILSRYPKPVHRDVLIEHFWPDSTPDSARNCLNALIHLIRRAIEKAAPGLEVIVFENECYGISPKLRADIDVEIFWRLWELGRRTEHAQGMKAAVDTYHQAFAFYRGDYLEDLPYEDWADGEREKLRETWLVILDRLSAHFLENGKFSICLNLCQQALDKDPALEETHRRLMACYHRLGMREKAIRQFQKCRDNLQQEFKVQPGKATVSLYETILNG